MLRQRQLYNISVLKSKIKFCAFKVDVIFLGAWLMNRILKKSEFINNEKSISLELDFFQMYVYIEIFSLKTKVSYIAFIFRLAHCGTSFCSRKPENVV